MGSFDESKSYCGVIQYYALMVATAVAIPILSGLFTVLFYCCRCCPCCKYKCCCYNCGGKQPRNKKTPEGLWVSGPYTKCEKSFWYSAHVLVIAVLLLLSIGGGFSVSAIPDNIVVIFDAIVYVIEIPGKFFEETASPAILTAISSMNREVTNINTNYSTAALAVKAAAAAAATACSSGTCCAGKQVGYAAIRDLAALEKQFDPNAFSGFLNNTLNEKLKDGKDKVKQMNVPTDTIKSFKDFPKAIPAGAGFVLFAPVFLPILINLLAFLCKKQCPFWCSHLCGFLFSGLVFLLFIVIFLLGSTLSEMCLFLPSSTMESVDTSGIEVVFPPSADGTPNDITNLFKHCLAKRKGGNMFAAVKYNITNEVNVIVNENINKDKLGLDADALQKVSPIPQGDINDCNGDATLKSNLETLQAKQTAFSSIVNNIDVSTRRGVSTVLFGFTDTISSCDVIAKGYTGLRDSICGGFSDSIFATYFSLYGCGIFLILFLITTMKIVKKVSRSGTVAPAEQAPKVAGAPPEAASAMSSQNGTTKIGANSKTKADQKEVKKPN
jgi:hypothetical protein